MKIAYFLDVASGVGGAGTLLLKQASLMKKYHDVVVIIPLNEKGGVNSEYASICEKMELAYKGLRYLTAWNFFEVDIIDALNCEHEVERFLELSEIDFVHSVQINVTVELATRKLQIPNLMNIYQLSEKEFIYNEYSFCAKYHLCDSYMYSKVWSEKLDVHSRVLRPISPIYNHRIGNKELQSVIEIVLVGNLYKRKNQLSVIKIIEKIKDKYRVHLTIAGHMDNQYGNMCQQYVLEHGLDDVISFSGFLVDMSGVYNAGHIMICASTDESFPSSIVEALSYGLIIVTTPVAGVPELFIDKNNAYVSENFESDSIQKSLEECINDMIRGEQLSIQNNMIMTWDNYFSQEKQSNLLNEYYEWIKQELRWQDVKSCNPVISIIDQLISNMDRFCRISEKYMSYAMRQALYLFHLYSTIKNRKVAIWGAGNCGMYAYEIARNYLEDIDIVAIIDSFKTGEFNGIKILKPSDFDWDSVDICFIAIAADREDIIQYVERKGLTYGKNVFPLYY